MLKGVLFTALLLAISLPSFATPGALLFPGAPQSWQLQFQSQRDLETWAQFTANSEDDLLEDPQLRQHLGQMNLHLGAEQMPVPLFLYAALRNDMVLIRRLHQAGIRPDLPADGPEVSYTALSAIAFLYSENGEVWAGIPVQINTETFHAVLHGVDFSGLSATDQYALFDVAMLRDDVVFAASLLDQGFPITWADEFGNTLFTHALWAQAYQIAELLLDRGIDPGAQTRHTKRPDTDAGSIIQTVLQHLPAGEEGDDDRDSLLRLQQKLRNSATAAGSGFF